MLVKSVIEVTQFSSGRFALDFGCQGNSRCTKYNRVFRERFYTECVLSIASKLVFGSFLTYQIINPLNNAFLGMSNQSSKSPCFRVAGLHWISDAETQSAPNITGFLRRGFIPHVCFLLHPNRYLGHCEHPR